MITKRIAGRKDGGSSAKAALRYGEGLKRDRKTGNLLSKSHRTRLGNFGLVDDGTYIDKGAEKMAEIIELAAAEMQATCDRNTRVGAGNKIAHFLFSFDQTWPSEAVLRDTEDSMLAALGLSNNHFVSFLHNDSGHVHLHMFASRIDKVRHRGNDLWQDKTIRDRVAREIEKRHGLERDNGLHRIDENGQIVEVPREEREKNRGLKSIITDRARTTEIHSGERTFQSWAEEFRLGDRLKHAKSWKDLHIAAAAYGCEVNQKGAGFVIHPIGEKGGIQLSRLGLKNLPAKFGVFQPAKPSHSIKPEVAYAPTSTNTKAAGHYKKWCEAKDAFRPLRLDRVNEQREMHKQIRQDLRGQHKSELEQIRAESRGAERYAAVSIAKMQHTIALAELAETFSRERKALRTVMATEGPGNTFREFLIKEAEKGDEVALQLARKYGADESTKVSRQHEESEFLIVAVVSGLENRLAPRLSFPCHVERSGTVVFDLGFGRAITDNAISRQVQLNDAAANSPEAIETALRFATTKFGNTLKLTGSTEFQRLAVETAVRKGLNINFYDPALQAYKQQFAASINHNNQERNHVTRTQPYQARRIPPAQRRDRMHQLSELIVDSKPKDVEVLLPQDVPDRLADRNEGRRNGDGLRRVGGRGAELVKQNTPLAPQLEHQETPLHSSSALEWATEWAKANHLKIVEPKPGDGKVGFHVIHVGQDGIVVNMGRSVSIYPKPLELDLQVGSKVVIGKNMQILLQQKKELDGKER